MEKYGVINISWQKDELRKWNAKHDEQLRLYWAMSIDINMLRIAVGESVWLMQATPTELGQPFYLVDVPLVFSYVHYVSGVEWRTVLDQSLKIYKITVLCAYINCLVKYYYEEICSLP